jgi:hypothetical protein
MTYEEWTEYKSPLKDAVKAFWKSCEKYQNFGVFDTEPHGQLEAVIKRAALGQPVNWGWLEKHLEIFHSMKGWFMVSRAIVSQARKLYDFIHTKGAIQDLEWLKGELSRVNWDMEPPADGTM